MTEPRSRLDQFLWHGLEVRARAALVVIDLQNDFCAPDGAVLKGGYAEDPEAIERAVDHTIRLALLLRRAAVPCIFVRSFLDDKYKLPSLLKRHRTLGITTQLCRENTWGAELYKTRLDASDCIVTKHTNDAFLYTFLEPLLRKAGADTLILSGVYTELCIEDTARAAIQRGFHVLVAEDCTAGLAAACTTVSLETMRALQIDVVSSSELLSMVNVERHSGPGHDASHITEAVGGA
jgi:ureidoacrylate peracid hydrolase